MASSNQERSDSVNYKQSPIGKSSSSQGYREYDDEKRRERANMREKPYARNEGPSHGSGCHSSSEQTSSMKGSEKKEKWGKEGEEKEEERPPVEIKPNFKASGVLAAQARTTESGIEMKYAAPAEARIPILKWKLYPFKGEESLAHISIHEKNFYLLGRDRDIVDIPLDHLSCSGQHAVIVHRQITKKDPDTGLKSLKVVPFLIDLESRNGTFLNDVKIDTSRYYEILEKDALRFGASSREYIVLHDKSTK